MKSSTRPTKRQRKEHPLTLTDNESLSLVASPYGPIATPLASIVAKEIVLERLRKEIVDRFGLVLSIPRNKKQHIFSKTGEKLQQGKCQESKKIKIQARLVKIQDPKITLLRSRMVFGVNQCTRALETTLTATIPTLLIVGRDLYPPNILSHIPLLARETNTPILLLPGNASVELGAALGTKKIGILLFLSRNKGDEELSAEDLKLHALIDSFIDFAKSKLP